MNQIWTITKRELQSYFDSLLAYIVIILFLGFTGFFTWLFGNDVFLSKEASLNVFFNISFWTLFFFVPLLTMRLIAEENSSGTLELILTKPLNEWQLVTGKFLSTIILISIALLLTLPYYFTIWSLGPVDHGAVWTGYLGLILMSSAYASIGIFASSVTKNQIVAVLIALLITIFFHLLFSLISFNLKGLPGNILNYLSTRTHYESITRGVIDTKDLIYFITLTFLGLFGSELVLAKRNVTES
ncbi:MAG: ABC transporter permease subunit [Bacteroidales bacterium]|nr:ABC transporter permease subunit [Bacteroidales bacterium]